MTLIAEGAVDHRAQALCARVATMVAAGNALEPIIEELLLRWSGVSLATIEAARRLAERAAAPGDELFEHTAFLLGLAGRTGLFV